MAERAAEGEMEEEEVRIIFNPLAKNPKISDVTDLKVFADDEINKAQTRISIFHRADNSEGIGENAGYLKLLTHYQTTKF